MQMNCKKSISWRFLLPLRFLRESVFLARAFRVPGGEQVPRSLWLRRLRIESYGFAQFHSSFVVGPHQHEQQAVAVMGFGVYWSLPIAFSNDMRLAISQPD